MLLHEMGPLHPESPQRIGAIEERLRVSGLMDFLRHYDAPLVTRQQLQRVHSHDYVSEVFALAPAEGRQMLDPDTWMNPHSLTAALRAAGAAVLATDLVIAGEVRSAFCCVRPPGHHAERDRAMGFCIFNNVALAAAHALEAHGLERVAIVDFDVHHGNGSEDCLRQDQRVLLISTFRHPFYPGTPFAQHHPHIVDVPLPAGTGGVQYRQHFSELCLPALERFAPQLILFSAGFDGHRDDEMGGWNLTESDYAWITAEVKAVAERHAEGRMVSVLEGGYELPALGRSVEAHLRVMMEL